MPAASASRGRAKSTCRSLSRRLPASLLSALAMILQSVLLPQPLAPSNAWISPGATVIRPSESAVTAPKRLTISRARNTGLMRRTLEVLCLVEVPQRLVRRYDAGYGPIAGLARRLFQRRLEIGIVHERDRNIDRVAI